VSRTTFASLFAVLGTTYGAGDGSTTFNVPDLRGRVPAGADAMGGTPANRLGSGNTGGITGSATPGAAGGQQSHTLTATEQASMSVSVSGSTSTAVTGVASTQQTTTPGDGSGTYIASLSSAALSVSASGGASGGGQPHNITQPTLVTNYIIKT
jgi:microcystin-dependent protein